MIHPAHPKLLGGVRIVTASIAVCVSSAGADISYETLAVSGQAAGTTPALFDNFTGQAINSVGQIVLSATLTESGSPAGSGVFSDATGTLDLIGRDGDAAPGTTGLDFWIIGPPVLNDAGHVVFGSTLKDAGGVFAGRGIWYEAGGVLTLLAKDGDAAPGTSSTFASFGNPVQNGAGQIAFFATMASGRGIWLEDGGSLDLIAQQGSSAPGTSFDFRSFGSPVLSDSVHLAFAGDLQDGGGAFMGRGMWLRNDLGTLDAVALSGASAPGTSLDYRSFGNPAVNNAGEVAFRADLQDGGGAFAGSGIWTDVSGSLSLVAQDADGAPGTSDDFRTFGNAVLNGAGQVAFSATLQDGGGVPAGSGIWADLGGSLSLIARDGDAAPGSSDTFMDFGTPVMNAAGDLAFFALLQDGGGLPTVTGIWLYDAATDMLIDIAIEGDTIEVAPGDTRTITSTTLGGTGSGGEDGRTASLNDDGHLVFELAFAGGSQAVFSASNEVADTDGDGLTDDEEINIYNTDPNEPDTDFDGLTDGEEVLDIFCGEFNDQMPDPLDADTDDDNLDDGEEFDLGTDLCNADTDGDGLTDDIDDQPLSPGASAGVIADLAFDHAQDIASLPLGLFDGRNNRARRGKRIALSNLAFIASIAVDHGRERAAIQLLTSLLKKVDGEPRPRDWMDDSPEKTDIANQTATLINLIELLE